MRPQTRPFMVETKTRNRARQPAISASFPRQDDRLDLIPPDDLPERDVNEDLTVAPAHEAFRAAERIFARIGGGTQAAQPSHSDPAPSPSLNLPEESCPIFLLPLASRSE